jgi:hypothetical protein
MNKQNFRQELDSPQEPLQSKSNEGNDMGKNDQDIAAEDISNEVGHTDVGIDMDGNIEDQNLEPGVSDRNTKQGAILEDMSDRMATGNETTGGDVDTDSAQAKVVGEEAVGGTTPTPDQDVVDDIGESVGVEFADKQPVSVRPTLERRDDKRWELDPDSAQQ